MSLPTRVLRPLNIAMTIGFLLCAAVQYNDPDPVQWMTIYGAAAGACLLSLRGRLPRWVAVLVAVVALAWSVAVAQGMVGRIAVSEILTLSNVTLLAEEGRETLGLLIVGLWMIVLAVAGCKPLPKEVRGWTDPSLQR